MKYYNPLLLFLDEDLVKSAQALSNLHLEMMIRNTSQILFCGLFYFIGIRNKKFYDFYFGKERKSESIAKWFPTYPMRKFPSFKFYNSVESRWVRKCGDHMSYLIDYFDILLEEHCFRYNRDHELYELKYFFDTIIPTLGAARGIVIPFVNLKKIVIPWKNLDPRFRKKDLIEGYRKYYRYIVWNPYVQCGDTKRDLPEWLTRGRDMTQFEDVD